MHRIEYSTSFVIFWGLGLSVFLVIGGLLSFAVVATIMLMLIHHEHAHAAKCLELGIPVHSITFSAFGGMVDARMPNTQDGIEVYKAGPVNSGCYAFSFVTLLFAVDFLGDVYRVNMVDPMPLGMLYWMQFLNSMTLSAVVLVVTNILPIWVYTKKYGTVAMDGPAVFLRREARDELWNDGRVVAQVGDGCQS